MNSESPVRTAVGVASAVSRTRTLIDSQVWPGGGEDFEVDSPEGNVLAVREATDRVVGFGGFAEADPGAGGLDQFEVPGDEVGVEVGVDHPRRC